jgi:cap2 methyltransferase
MHPENSPHCMQVKRNTPHQRYEINAGFHRILAEDAPEMTHAQSNDAVKTVVHWSQRKLLMAEIEFLTMMEDSVLANAVVIYAGAAPGTHIPYLMSLFPTVSFVLVDPKRFCTELRALEAPTLILVNKLFTDDLAKRLKRQYDDKNILFVSDIRTANPDRMLDFEVEACVKADMKNQMRWHQILDPHRSMLKFRLPWNVPGSRYEETTEYLDGDIYFPVWGPRTTTECMLITKHGAGRIRDTGLKRSRTVVTGLRTYNNKKYESQNLYFHRVLRPSLYDHQYYGNSVEGIDHCYDCRAELEILYKYDARFRNFPEKRSSWSDVKNMSEEISKKLDKTRTLQTTQSDEDDENAPPASRIIRANMEDVVGMTGGVYSSAHIDHMGSECCERGGVESATGASSVSMSMLANLKSRIEELEMESGLSGGPE